MNCLDCVHSASNGGPCLDEMAQRVSISDGSCCCFLDMNRIVVISETKTLSREKL